MQIFYGFTKNLLSENYVLMISRYHIPRSWLQPSNNLLVIFEETNIAPLQISIEPRFTSTICSEVRQDHYPLNAWSDGQLSSNIVAPELHLQCDDGHTISSIEFASYGTPQGYCQQFSQGNCHAPSSSSVISQVCNFNLPKNLTDKLMVAL